MTENNKGVPKMENIPPMPKPRTYKLTPEQLTEQVIALETTDLKVLQSYIAREIESRKAKHLKALAELEGK